MKSFLGILIHNDLDILFGFKCFDCDDCLISDLSSSDNGSVFDCVGCLSDKNSYSKN